MITIKYNERFREEVFSATISCSKEEYKKALEDERMYTNCIHSAEWRAAAVICGCSPDDVESIEEDDL